MFYYVVTIMECLYKIETNENVYEKRQERLSIWRLLYEPKSERYIISPPRSSLCVGFRNEYEKEAREYNNRIIKTHRKISKKERRMPLLERLINEKKIEVDKNLFARVFNRVIASKELYQKQDILQEYTKRPREGSYKDEVKLFEPFYKQDNKRLCKKFGWNK